MNAFEKAIVPELRTPKGDGSLEFEISSWCRVKRARRSCVMQLEKALMRKVYKSVAFKLYAC